MSKDRKTGGARTQISVVIIFQYSCEFLSTE